MLALAVKMKGFPVCMGILFCIIIGLLMIDHTKMTYEDFTDTDLLRFHIRAESNDQTAMKVKMEVRYRVLTYIRKNCGDTKSKKDLQRKLLKNRKEIELLVKDTLKKYGMNPQMSMYFTKEFFPMKQYGQTIVPAGMYEAFRIDLGKAKGRNWWCVLYPSLCLIDPDHVLEDPKEKEKYDRIFEDPSVKVRYKSYLIEHLKQLDLYKSGHAKQKYPERQTDRGK